MLHEFLEPELSESMRAFIRSAYGVLLLAHLLACLPNGRRFFLSERWGGYGKSSRRVDFIQNPIVYPAAMAVWLACAVALIAGWCGPCVALVNLLICRYYFLHMRWHGLSRGMGAPGFLTCWLATAVFLLEFAAHYVPSSLSLCVLVMQVDFALIMLLAGLAKYNDGYRHNQGMEFGMANPQWGHFCSLYRRWRPNHWFFKFNNHLAWTGEITAAAMMLFPPTRFWGGLFMLISFVYIGLNVRLLLLPHMVMLACCLFMGPNTPGEWVLRHCLPSFSPSSAPAINLPVWVSYVFTGGLCAYLALLPFADAGLYVNFYFRKSLPRTAQICLEAFTNFFGLILWRVFTADVTCFFIQIYSQPRDGGPRRLISNWRSWRNLRYHHVAEAITVTTLFTTLKYYPSNSALFQDRLLRYARTLPKGPGNVLVFEYMSIRKVPDEFTYVPVKEYVVDLDVNSIEEIVLDESFDVSAKLERSSIYETKRPGSYAPSGS